MSGVALTFFAFLGFGVVTFTAKDLADPASQLPRAMAIAIGLATAIYIAVAIGVFGTLTVPEVIAAGPTAIAVAAQPVLGQAGYYLMSITALFATAGATNAGLYPATGLSDELAATGQFPTVMAGRIAQRASVGLVVAAAGIILLVVAFDLSSVASIGSAVALTIFALVTVGHLRVRAETGARVSILVLALLKRLPRSIARRGRGCHDGGSRPRSTRSTPVPRPALSTRSTCHDRGSTHHDPDSGEEGTRDAHGHQGPDAPGDRDRLVAAAALV